MASQTQCPALVPPYQIINNVLTNNSTLQVSTTERSVGTEVKLSCKFNYTLIADSPTTTCQSNGTWNFSKDPTCILPNASTGLTEDQKIILAVAGGVGAIVLIILLIMVCLICSRKRQSSKKGLPKDGGNSLGDSTVRNDDFLGPPMDQYQYAPRPDYGYDNDVYNQGGKNAYAPQPPYSQRRFDNPAFVNDQGPDRRRQYAYDTDRRLEQSYRDNPPVVDYDREYFGGRPTPRDPRDRRDIPRNSISSRPQFTNSVRMYEEYGRPARVGMLEEAYALQMDTRSPSSTMNMALRGMATSRSIDSYGGYRGGDPTRYNRY